MEKPLPGQPDYLDASIKTAQFLPADDSKDIWRDGKVLAAFLAQIWAFGTIGKMGNSQSPLDLLRKVFRRAGSGSRDREAIAECWRAFPHLAIISHRVLSR